MATIWKVRKLKCEVLNQQDGTVIAHWQFDTGTTTDRFGVWWEYWNTTTRTWVLYESSVSSDKWENYQSGQWFQSVWTPDDAPTSTKVRCYVRPWATKDSNGNYRWKSGGAYSNQIKNPKLTNLQADFMVAPDLDLDYYQDGIYRFTWDSPPTLATHIIVYMEENGSGKFNKLKTYSVTANQPTVHPYSDNRTRFATGGKFRFRAEWSMDKNGDNTSNMSLITTTFFARPCAPTNLACSLVSCDANEGQVKVSWKDSGYSGNSYRIEYSEYADAWDNHVADIDSVDWDGAPSGGANACTVPGLEPGKRYYFRVKRLESRAEDYYQESAYATVGPKDYTVSCVVGTRPVAPTLGIIPLSVDMNEPLTLSWTHNSEDGSAQTAYELRASVSGGAYSTISTGTTSMSHVITPNSIAGDGDVISWQVRTKGGLDTGSATDWSPWSAVGTITAYAIPAPTITVSDMDSYPLEIGISTPVASAANAAERCVVQVLSAEDYETVMPDGETGYVTQGDVIWSGEHVFGEETSFDVSLMPQDAIFSEGITYEVHATVITKLGMVGDATPATFSCDITDSAIYGCDCEATFDRQTLAATIMPTCTDGPDGSLTSGLTLSVWRVTPDGTELVSDGLPNDGTAVCVDQHPTFGSCTYRVVAMDDQTGGIGFSDATFSWRGPGVVIQWDESFTEPSNGSEGVIYSGHRLVLPYNIDVTEQWDKESSLNEWAGRKHPVSRYGTQRGHTATWACDIRKLGGLPQTNEVRTLASYMGDCHVREPYGSGYRAHVQVSGVSYAHADGAVHVSLSVTRVEE